MNLELIPKLQQVDLLNKARKIKTALKIVHIHNLPNNHLHKISQDKKIAQKTPKT